MLDCTAPSTLPDVTTKKPPLASAPRIAGRATAAGTARYAERVGTRFASDFYRVLDGDALRVSSIGVGTYLGECTDHDDAAYADTVHLAIASGVNLIDSAINYRCQRSERSVGRAVARAVRGETAPRDAIVVCTKGGYVPLDGTLPASREEYREYVQREYLDRGIMTPDEVVGGAHCLARGYLADQIDRSRANLGVDTIDVYYVHNPEQQLDAVSAEELDRRLREAFALLEERCADGTIGVYGCATWNGLRTPPDVRGHLSLASLVDAARAGGGEKHHFRVVQLPVNLALPEAVRSPTQRLPDGRLVTVLEAAAELGVAVVASASLLQAKLASSLPATLREALPGFSSDAQRAIAFVRGLPVVASALVGMKSAGHLRENLGAGRAVS